MDQRQRGTALPVIRRTCAGLLILPLLGGLGIASFPGDVLYPTGDAEKLATARVGAWVAALSVVAFVGLDIMANDRRTGARLALIASLLAGTVAVAHDLLVGWGFGLAMVFFVPATLYAIPQIFAKPVATAPRLLLNRSRRLMFLACLVGLGATYFWAEASLRGLAIDVGMLIGAIASGAVMFTSGVLFVRADYTRSTVAVLATLVIGAIALREYFIAQVALFGAAAYLSHRLSPAVVDRESQLEPAR